MKAYCIRLINIRLYVCLLTLFGGLVGCGGKDRLAKLHAEHDLSFVLHEFGASDGPMIPFRYEVYKKDVMVFESGVALFYPGEYINEMSLVLDDDCSSTYIFIVDHRDGSLLIAYDVYRDVGFPNRVDGHIPDSVIAVFEECE